uniref:Uncharacterized protein n=1 Tax=Arundo donax TaxID=35708 RepID=A0A0A8Y2S5_ARUDO
MFGCGRITVYTHDHSDWSNFCTSIYSHTETPCNKRMKAYT